MKRQPSRTDLGVRAGLEGDVAGGCGDFAVRRLAVPYPLHPAPGQSFPPVQMIVCQPHRGDCPIIKKLPVSPGAGDLTPSQKNHVPKIRYAIPGSLSLIAKNKIPNPTDVGR